MSKGPDALTRSKRPPREIPDAQAHYNAQVKQAIRERLFARWPPSTDEEWEHLEANARFFESCSYEESDADGRSLEEVADDEIDAASDSQ